MREEILENIKEALNKEMSKEVVVYLMVEFRKLVPKEISQSDENWQGVKYWADWVVHTYLENKYFAVKTLEKMESFILKNPSDKFHLDSFNHNFVSLENLRWKLSGFLRDNSLPTNITNIPPWDDFCRYLIMVLRDTPLVKKNGLVRKFLFVKKDHLAKLDKYSIDYEIHFDGSRPNIEGSVLSVEH